MTRGRVVRTAASLASRLVDEATVDRLVVVLSLTALYGQQLLGTLTVGPLADLAGTVGPLLRGVEVFYWVGVAMMYVIHLFSIKAVYSRFEIEFLQRYPTAYHAFAGVATIIAQYVLLSSIPSQTAPAYLNNVLTSVGVVAPLSFGGLLLFAKLRSARPLSHPESSYLGVLSLVGISQSEIATLHDTTDFRRFAPYLLVLTVTALYVMPLGLMGSFTAALRIYPGVLELLAIGAVIGAKALRTARMGKQRVTLANRFEQAAAFDSPFYDVISDTPFGAGWGVILALLFGVILVPIPILMMPPLGPFPFDLLQTAVAGLLPATNMPLSQAVGTLMRVWVWVVIATTPYLVAVFGLWFWYQTALRAPSVIQRRAAESDTYEYGGPATEPPVARPRGWLLPAGALLLVVFSHPLYVMPGIVSPVLDAPSVQIAAWVTAMSLFAWCILATAAAEPEWPASPTVEFVAPTIVVPTAYIFAIRNWDVVPGMVVVVGAVLFVMHSERITRWTQAPTRRQRGLRAGVVGLLAALAGWYAASPLPGLGIGLFATGVFLFGSEWGARNEATAKPSGESEQNGGGG